MPAAQQRRATLFVGALALEALEPACASGADIVCIDLEDAVPPDRKAEARAAALQRLKNLAAPAGVHLIARVNTVTSRTGRDDLQALSGSAIQGVLLPKVESAEEIRLAQGLGGDVYAIIESPRGLEHCASIAAAGVKALFFGGFDLSTSLGCAMAWEPLLYARSRVVHAAALGGIEAIDSPFPDVHDLEGLRADCERVKALGMTGKCAKHASQVAAIREAFTPTPAEIDRARKILELFRADPTRPLVYEGKLVELPAIKKLERMVSR